MLGILALAALIGLVFLCRRRRNRKSRAAVKARSDLPSDDESDIWTREKHRSSFKGPTERTRNLGDTDIHSTAPLASRLSQDKQYSGYGPYPDRDIYGSEPAYPNHHNANDRPHADDTAANFGHPYSPDHVQQYDHNGQPLASTHGHGGALAAGIGGAVLGGLAAHEARHSESRSRRSNGIETPYSEDEQNALPQASVVPSERRSGSVGRASAKEPWPFLAGQERTSMDSARSRPRSMSRGRDQLADSDQYRSERPSMPSDAALIGTAAAGGLAGAAVARHTGSRSPHRKGILKNTRSNSAGQSLPTETNTSGPHELESFDVPTPKRTSRDRRRHSPLGYAAPAAAIGANHSPDRSRRKSWNTDPAHPEMSAYLPHEYSQDSDVPGVPSRSPRRNSLHSNARYSTANEGTVELPGHPDDGVNETRELVSPHVGPAHGGVDNDGVISPISPTNSQPSTWSRAQAAELGMVATDGATKTSSQESTVVETSPMNSSSVSRENSKAQSSGLVTAIQRIFNSPKQSWYAEDTATPYPPRRSLGERARPMSENFYDDDSKPISSVPHRKPVPAATKPYQNQYSQIQQNEPVSVEKEGPQPQPRKSSDSARSLPLNGPRYYARVNSNEAGDLPPPMPAAASTITQNPAASPNINPFSDPNPTPTPQNLQNTSRQRTPTPIRPAYGIGSGDPFDLARVRTDSSMTGISLINYVDPAKHAAGAGVGLPNTATNNNDASGHNNHNNDNEINTSATRTRPARKSTSSSTNEYPQPTLAELRQQVVEEDRERWRQSQRWSAAIHNSGPGSGGENRRRSGSNHSRRSFGAGTRRKSGEGSRYGDDRELFGSLIPGVDGWDYGYANGDGRGYGGGGNGGRGAAGVGTAY